MTAIAFVAFFARRYEPGGLVSTTGLILLTVPILIGIGFELRFRRSLRPEVRPEAPTLAYLTAQADSLAAAEAHYHGLKRLLRSVPFGFVAIVGIWMIGAPVGTSYTEWWLDDVAWAGRAIPWWILTVMAVVGIGGLAIAERRARQPLRRARTSLEALRRKLLEAGEVM